METDEVADGGEPERLDSPLPESVRARVVSIASDGLGALAADEVPPALRPFAKFAPARRVKLAATPLAAAIENDRVFRARIAERVRVALPDLADSLYAGVAPSAADPADIAAVAYLTRPPGWVQMVEEAAASVRAASEAAAGQHAQSEIDRLKAEVEAARDAGRAEGDRLRGELAELGRETDALRRRVRQAEANEKRAAAEARKAAETAKQSQTDAAASVAGLEAEIRRMRSRLAEAENALEAGRRAAREGRNSADTRLRLLLDTLSGAVAGLGRELALPPVTIRPGDTAGGLSPDAVTPGDLSTQARGADDPALLDEYLALPEVHLVIDGYNVTKTGFPQLSLHEQRLRLLRGLAGIAAQTRAEVTCVFDGAELGGPVPLAAPRGVRVLFSRPGETADELIRRLVAVEPAGRPIVVVSSDREVADGVRRSGAHPVPSSMLLRRLSVR